MIIVRLGEVRERTVISNSGICRDNLSKKTSVSAIVKSSLQDYSQLEEDRLLFLDSVDLLFNNTLLSFHRKLLFRIVYSNDSALILYHKTQPMHLAKNKKKQLNNDDYRWIRDGGKIIEQKPNLQKFVGFV